MARASRTTQQPLGYQPAHAAWFAATKDLFNQVAAFYFAVIATHPGVLDLDAKAALRALEQLTHSTKDNPHPAMPLSTIASTIPATFRRAAIHAALGAARSFSTHLEQWRRRKAKARAKGKHFTRRPPVPPRTWNRAVTLYAGMWKDRQGTTIMLKLWTGHIWCWLKCRLSGRAIPDGWEVGSPALVQHGTQWWMHTSIAKQLKHPGTVEQQVTANPGTRICAIDLNMDSSLAVCTVQTSEGTVLATRFIGGGKEIHGIRSRWLGRIARRRRDTGIIAAGEQDNAQLWANVRHLDEQTAHRVSRRVVEFAAAHGATVLAFEHLGNLTPDKGKYSRRANAKRMYWLKGRIFHYTKYKAWQVGMVTSRVNPRNTSRDCARCGARVARYHAGHAAEGYTPGAPLVCCASCGMKGQADRNASLVIGQRLITRYQKQREEKPHAPRRERPAQAGGVAGSQDAEGEEQPSTDLARYGAGNGFGTTQGELHGMASSSSVSLGHYGAQESSGHAAHTLNADYPGVQEEAARL